MENYTVEKNHWDYNKEKSEERVSINFKQQHIKKLKSSQIVYKTSCCPLNGSFGCLHNSAENPLPSVSVSQE